MAFRREHYAIAFVGGLAIAAATAGAVWWRSPGVDLSAWRSGPPPGSWAARSRQEERWRAEGISRHVAHEYRSLDEIAVNLQLAVLVAEDIGFLDHGVLDLRAVWEAFGEWRRGARLRGASTISQQLAKSLFLTRERSLWRKAKEVKLAWWLERQLGKSRVFELYLNVVEFGPGILGAEAAARRYFGASAADLDAEQAAALAAAIPSPGRDNPATGSRRLKVRQGLILERMGRAAWLRRRLEAPRR